MSGAGKKDGRYPANDPYEPTAELPAPRLETGCPVAHFRIERQIGRGGMGIVYLARRRRRVSGKTTLRITATLMIRP